MVQLLLGARTPLYVIMELENLISNSSLGHQHQHPSTLAHACLLMAGEWHAYVPCKRRNHTHAFLPTNVINTPTRAPGLHVVAFSLCCPVCGIDFPVFHALTRACKGTRPTPVFVAFLCAASVNAWRVNFQQFRGFMAPLCVRVGMRRCLKHALLVN